MIWIVTPCPAGPTLQRNGIRLDHRTTRRGPEQRASSDGEGWWMYSAGERVTARRHYPVFPEPSLQNFRKPKCVDNVGVDLAEPEADMY